MDDGRHGYFSPLLALAIVSVVLFSSAAFARMTAKPSSRLAPIISSPLVWCVSLVVLQVAGFAALEFLEGHGPDLIGCGVEAFTALLLAAFVLFSISFAERYAAPAVAKYLRRVPAACSAILRLTAESVQPPARLAVCAGMYRFKRPPPVG